MLSYKTRQARMGCKLSMVPDRKSLITGPETGSSISTGSSFKDPNLVSCTSRDANGLTMTDRVRGADHDEGTNSTCKNSPACRLTYLREKRLGAFRGGYLTPTPSGISGAVKGVLVPFLIL